MCARVDHQFGLVCDALRQAGMWDDTTFFVFSDHGDFTGDYGLVEKTQNTFEDCLARVPFLVKPPRGVEVQPRVSGALVELVDFAATVYDLTGIEAGYTHFGRSLRAVLAGDETHRDAVFCEGGRLPDETQAMERSSSSAFDENGLYWPRTSWQVADGSEHGKAVMCRTKTHKYVRRLLESDELYDLQSDPHEQHNRINDPALADVLSQLKDRLLTHYQQTCDVVPMHEDKR